MLLYVMLYIVLAYLMLFAAITNAVCLNNAFILFYFFIDLCKCFFFMLCLCLFHFFFICIMHSAFNLFLFSKLYVHITVVVFFFTIIFMIGL